MTDEEINFAIAEACGELKKHHIRNCRDYCNDFNAIYGAEKQLGLHDRNNLELRVKWVGILRDLVAPFCPLNKVGTPVVSDLDILTADVKIKAMALVKLTQKKKKK